MKAAFYDQTDAKEPLLRQLFGSKNTGVGHETCLISRNLRSLVPPTVSLCQPENVNGWSLHAWFPT